MITNFSKVILPNIDSDGKLFIQDSLKTGTDSIHKRVLQDSIAFTVKPDSSAKRTDTVSLNNRYTVKNSINRSTDKHLPQTESQNVDTVSFCKRNSIADITFFNPDFVINSINECPVNRFPFLFTEHNARIHSEQKEYVIKHLRDGSDLPKRLFHDDWVIGIVLIALILFAIVQTTTKSFIPGLTRFFLFRGAKEDGTRDLIGIFQWQSTIMNFSSFVIISLFAFFAASYFDIIPENISGITVWLISLAVIIAALTLRHIVCVLTGILSGQDELFRDYLHTVYQSYRFGALFLFILVILMAYTRLLSEKSYFIIGVSLLLSLYLIRITRLLIIFINRNISIFYLILYLCALEILPVLLSIKYFSGLA
jgi:hypothetical protein